MTQHCRLPRVHTQAPNISSRHIAKNSVGIFWKNTIDGHFFRWNRPFMSKKMWNIAEKNKIFCQDCRAFNNLFFKHFKKFRLEKIWEGLAITFEKITFDTVIDSLNLFGLTAILLTITTTTKITTKTMITMKIATTIIRNVSWKQGRILIPWALRLKGGARPPLPLLLAFPWPQPVQKTLNLLKHHFFFSQPVWNRTWDASFVLNNGDLLVFY